MLSAWGLAFERGDCGEVAQPLLSRDEKTVHACGGLFDAETGAFIGQEPEIAPRALLPDGRPIAIDLESGGIRVGEQHVAGGFVEDLAVSPDGSHVATVERTAGPDGDRYGFAVYDARTLATSWRRPVQMPPHRWFSHAVGFTHDDRVVFTVPPTACPSSGQCGLGAIVALDGAAEASLPVGGGLHGVAFAPDGSVAVFARLGHGVRVVSLPEARPVADIDLDASTVLRLAVTSGGERVCVVTDDTLAIYELTSSGYSRVFAGPGRNEILQFSRDGHRLYTASSSFAMYRAGVAPRPRPPTYSVSPPAGFESGRYANGTLTFAGAPGDEWAVRTGEVAAFRDNRGTIVRVLATPADELALGDDDLDAWGHRVLARFAPRTDDGLQTRVWRGRGRSLEYRFTSDGCDVRTTLVRVIELDSWVWRVELQAAPDEAWDQVVRWLVAFVDGPFGAPPERTKSEVVARTGC
jgi:hypothetical protein